MLRICQTVGDVKRCRGKQWTWQADFRSTNDKVISFCTVQIVANAIGPTITQD